MTDCWCREVREKETAAIQDNGNLGESDYECWQCRDKKKKSELINNADYIGLALHNGIDNFDDFSRVMQKEIDNMIK